MKISLVHDGIFCRAGGERVLLNFHKAFPDAPIYTSIYDPENSFSEFKNCNIKTTWLQKIANNEAKFKNFFFPLGMYAMQSHNLNDYDIILCTTTHCAKYIRTNSKTLVINYCFTPFRLAWNPNSYTLYSNSNFFKKILLDIIVKILRKHDFYHSQKTSNYIAMTDETADRIKDSYKINNDIPIIMPSINTDKYFVSNKSDEYYLVVSRLEKYKKVDLVINAFNKLGYKLKIVGNGVEKEYLKSLAKDNIEFLHGISDDDLSKLYSKCKAFIFPQHEDYGLTPLEANASGRPVIAYGKGGVTNTMIKFDRNSDFTGIFFDYQSVPSLIEAINLFESNYDKVNSSFIRSHAEKFDDTKFIKKIKNHVSELYNQKKISNYA